MKLAILTQPLYNNYGGILQNYALQTFLRKLGHEVTTVNFKHKPLKLPAHKYVVEYTKNVLRWILGKKIYCIDPYRQDVMVFTSSIEKSRFIEKFINKIDVYPPLDKEWIINQNFDGYVVGSDQIWRPKYSPCISNFFLDFTECANVKRVAYAASFGVDEWEYSPKLTETASKMLPLFNGISVREKSGVDLCKRFLHSEASHVIDPTMLLLPENYYALFEGNSTIRDEYILCYALDYSRDIKNIVSKLPEKFKAKVIYVSGENIGNEAISVERWLQMIAGARYVVTDSFHGTVFSILFHKPFYSVINKDRGADRVLSLLNMFNLRIYQDEYDWESVDDKLNKYRIDARSFIIKSLS